MIFDAFTEISLLAFLAKGDVEQSIVMGLENNIFSSLEYQQCLMTIKDMIERDIQIGMMTFRQRLMDRGWYDKVGGDNFIAKLYGGQHGMKFEIPSYLERLKNLATRRRILDNLHEIEKKCSDESPIDSVMMSIADLNDSFIEKQRAMSMDKVRLKTDKGIFSYGMEELDNLLYGMFPGQLIVIGARTRIGKSTLALQIAKNNALRGVNVLMFPMEMGASENKARLVASMSGISPLRIRANACTSKEMEYVKKSEDFLDTNCQSLLFSESDDIDSIRADIMTSLPPMGGMAIIDYIQLISGGEGKSRYEKIGFITKSLKKMAKKMKIPIIAVATLGRETETRPPVLSDFRESGDVEQDADVCIFVHKEEPRATVADIIVAKARDASVGIIPCTHIMARYSFEPIKKEEQNESQSPDTGWDNQPTIQF